MSKKVEKELVELERQYWQALKDKDFDAALKLTDDPCIVSGAQGVGKLDRKSLVEMMKAGPYTLDDFELGADVKVRMLGDDVAIIAYKVHEELTVDGKPVTLDAADASTWVRRGGHWVCALHTESIEGDPFGRDRNGVQA
ncbi:MAG TPA: nuclear transport factor 2 family protein [Polyangiaceae bacterium]